MAVSGQCAPLGEGSRTRPVNRIQTPRVLHSDGDRFLQRLPVGASPRPKGAIEEPSAELPATSRAIVRARCCRFRGAQTPTAHNRKADTGQQESGGISISISTLWGFHFFSSSLLSRPPRVVALHSSAPRSPPLLEPSASAPSVPPVPPHSRTPRTVRRIPSIAMAETATATATAPAADKAPATRPTKPDENVFKEELAKAEKAHKASMDLLVRPQFLPP